MLGGSKRGQPLTCRSGWPRSLLSVGTCNEIMPHDDHKHIGDRAGEPGHRVLADPGREPGRMMAVRARRHTQDPGPDSGMLRL